MSISEAGGWKALWGSRAYIFNLQSLKKLNTVQAKQNILVYSVYHMGLQLTEPWSNSTLKFINEETKA